MKLTHLGRAGSLTQGCPDSVFCRVSKVTAPVSVIIASSRRQTRVEIPFCPERCVPLFVSRGEKIPANSRDGPGVTRGWGKEGQVQGNSDQSFFYGSNSAVTNSINHPRAGPGVGSAPDTFYNFL